MDEKSYNAILEYLETSYSGAKMLDDIECMCRLLQRTNQGERQPCADEKQMPARFKAECGGYLSDESGNE